MRRSLLRGIGTLILAAASLFALSASADTVETLVMPGKVIEGHADIEGQCRKCHQPFKKEGQNALCLDCHKAVAQDVASKVGYHGTVPEKPCRECHATSDKPGRVGLKTAYHKACFKCHKADVGSGVKNLTGCTEMCHALKAKGKR